MRLALLFATFAFLSNFAWAEDSITLGFIGPLTGDVAGYGKDAERAIGLAISELNASGYLPGKKLKVIYEDGKCRGKDAVTALQKLISKDGVKIVFGGMCSGETLAAAPVAEREEVILLSAFSSSPDVTNAGEFVFRVAPNDKVGGKKAAQFALRRGYKRVGLVSENTDYAAALAQVFVKEVEAGGGSIVANETFNPGTTDVRPILLRMKAKNPEVIFLNPQGGIQAGLLVKQLKQIAWDVPRIGTYAFSSADAVEAAGGIQLLEGLYFIDVPIVSSDKGKEFIEKFKKSHPVVQSDYVVAFSYDTAYLVAQAIREVGLDTKKIRDYWYALPAFEGISETYRFDKYGDVVGVDYSLKEYRNGKIEVVE